MVAYRFEETEWGPTKPRTQNPNKDQVLGDIRFRQLFKTEDWNRLPAPVRRRFGRRVQTGEALIYKGHVEFNRVNIWGRILVNLLRVIGAPLPLDTENTDAAAVVTVTEAPGKNGKHGGQIWMRQYARKDTKHPFPQIIQSAKRFEGPTGIEEYIGGGIGMSLKACVEGKELVFNAEDIFWDIKFLAFTLKLEHKWFGKMIDQRVWFQDDLEPQNHLKGAR